MTIKRQRYLPYAYAERALEVEIRALRSNSEELELELALDRERCVIDLRDYSNSPECIHIDVAVHGIDAALFSQVLPANERTDPPLRYTAILRDGAGWYRVVTLLEKTTEGTATGTLAFCPLDSTGSAHLEVVATRTAHSTEKTPGYAALEGMRVAASLPVEVITQDPPQLPGGSLDIRWEDFATSTHPERSGHDERIFYFEITADPPILWLNRSITDLPTVLESKATTHYRAAIRDLLNQAIAGPVWYALLHSIMMTVAPDEEGRAALPEGWRVGLLARLAPRLRPNDSRERALQHLLDRIYDLQQDPRIDDGYRLVEELVAAIHDELDLTTITRRALRELRR